MQVSKLKVLLSVYQLHCEKCQNFFFVCFLPFVPCCLEISTVLHLDESLFTEIYNRSLTVLLIKELHLLLSQDINFYSLERWQRIRIICAAMALSSSQAVNSSQLEVKTLWSRNHAQAAEQRFQLVLITAMQSLWKRDRMYFLMETVS